MICIAPVYLDLPQNRIEYILDKQSTFKFTTSKKDNRSTLINYQNLYTECEFDLTERDLQDNVNYLASQSFNEIWENEDDDYWNSYL